MMKQRVHLLLAIVLCWLLRLPLSIHAFVGTPNRYPFLSSRKSPAFKSSKLFLLEPNGEGKDLDCRDFNDNDNPGVVPTSIREAFRQVSMTLNDNTGGIQDHANIQKRLVHKGLDFDVYRQHADFTNLKDNDGVLVLTSAMDRVPGCVATVHLQTALVPIDGTSNNGKSESYRVWLNGTADAMLSRGLLASLSEALSGYTKGRLDSTSPSPSLVTAHDVLQIEPESVSTMLHLENVLSKGRNDGLASMMRVVQGQIESLLGRNVNSDKLTDKHDMPATLNGNSPITSDTQKGQKSVAMLLSGGVDSSVALNLLKQEGYNVTAFYLKIWLEDELAHLGQCPWEDDYQVCTKVCQQANVPLETISLQEEYKDRVIAYTVQEARRGRTPNPDIMCNSRVKFGCFYDTIANRGFDHVASGHYAQLLKHDGGGFQRLLRAPDPVKDQSYFLCALTQEQMNRVLFPIGHLQKSEVRQLANDFDLPNQHRPDSQGLCFLGKVKFDDFLSAYLGDSPGPILDAATGEVLGQHRGVWYHTVGQRKGIGKVLDPRATSRGPWYVVAKDPERKIVFVSNQYDEEVFTTARSDFYIEDLQWIRGEAPLELFQSSFTHGETPTPILAGKFHLKIRHGPKLVVGTLELDNEVAPGGNVRLENKDGGLAPGQFVVVYTLDGSECLGCGVISERHWARFLLDQESIVSHEQVVETTS